MRVSKKTLATYTVYYPLLEKSISKVHRMGMACSVETAGTIFYPELREVFSPTRSIADNLIVCSPKTPKIADGLEEIVGAWKYIVQFGSQDADGLPRASTQIEGRVSHLFRPSLPSVPIYVQPMDELDEMKNKMNLKAAVTASQDHGYRLCIQMHKIAGLE